MRKSKHIMPVVVNLDSNSSIADNSFEAEKNVDICARGTNMRNAILITSRNSKKTKKKGIYPFIEHEVDLTKCLIVSTDFDNNFFAGNDVHILGSKSKK